jgi:prevent-host-death family protein
MRHINIHEAKTHFLALVEEAAAGEPFVIAKSGKPIVTVIPYAATAPPPRIVF